MKIAESTVSPQWHVILPVAVRTALNVEAGDKVEWHAENNTLYVKKKAEK